MNLSFRVKNAGPLTNIGLEIISLDTAIHLATGAYGWFKAHERSKSLAQILSANGGELVATSSFNLTAYRDARPYHGVMQGVVVQRGFLDQTPLPKASTAVPSDPGVACLRALTTGILCYFDIDTTVAMLQELIPYALIQMEQEGSVMEILGPLLAGLKQWVLAVATE